MITNERQYRISKSQANKFREAIKGFDEFALIREGIDPIIAVAQREGLKSQLEDLERSLEHFDALRSGRAGDLEADTFDDVGVKLIEARIASGLTQKDLAVKLGLKEQQIQRYEQGNYRSASLARISEVVSALDFSVTFKLMQPNHRSAGDRGDEFRTLNIKLPHREMRKRGWLNEITKPSQTNMETDVELAALYVQRAHGPNASYALHKRTRLGDQYDEGALLAWKARILRLARDAIPAAAAGNIADSTFLNELVSLSRLEDGPVRAVNLLREAGVIVVVERHLPRTHLDGAAMLLDRKHPVIGLTLRHDRLDNFWFVLMHEIGHIVRHRHEGLEQGFFDDDTARLVESVEQEADDFARNALIPDELWRSSFVQFANSSEKIRVFAGRAGVHPAIVAGRIRRERSDYSVFTEVIGRNKLRNLFVSGSSVVGGYDAV